MVIKKSLLVIALASVLALTLSFSLLSLQVHAATRNSDVQPQASQVSCAVANLVRLFTARGACYGYGGSPGFASVNNTIVRYQSDQWSGFLKLPDGGEIYFCDNEVFGINYGNGYYFTSIYLSPTKEPWC